MTTAGQKLKAARLEKALSLDDVSKATKIKTSFLEFIEKGEYDKLPSTSYAHGFVKNYCLFLGLNEKELMAIFRREFNPENKQRVLPKGFETNSNYNNSKFRLRSTGLIIGAVFVLLFGFIAFQYRSAFLNPSLVITTPKNDSVVFTSQITVEGKTDSDATIYVDKNEVSVDSNGNFSKTINVFPGDVNIVVKSINKFQKQTEKKISINVRGS